MAIPIRGLPALTAVLTTVSLGGCGYNPYRMTASLTERDCLARAMYFESNRSSEDGMLAVGTVVMNRLQSPRYPKSVCGVVGQERQFADGALSKPVESRSYARALKVADKVLAGDRHDKVGAAMFFHTAGYTFPYRNMAYLAAAGGNVFYEKKTPGTFKPIHPATLVARAEPVAPKPAPAEAAPTRLASAGTRAEPVRAGTRVAAAQDRTRDRTRDRPEQRRFAAETAAPRTASAPAKEAARGRDSAGRKELPRWRAGSVTIAEMIAKDEAKPKRLR